MTKLYQFKQFNKNPNLESFRKLEKIEKNTLQEVKEMEERIIQRISSDPRFLTDLLKTVGKAIVGEKGEKGDTPELPVLGVDYYTPEEIEQVISYIESRIKVPIDGTDGINGKNGKDGFTPVPGIDYPTKEQIKELVTAEVYKLFSISENVKKEDVVPVIEKIQQKIDFDAEAAKIARALETLKGKEKLDYNALKNIPAIPKGTKTYARGGLPIDDFVKIDQTTPQTITGGAPIFAEGLNAGDAKITNVDDPTLPTDAVNLQYVQNSLGVDLNYWLEASSVMQTTYVGTPGFVTQTPTQEAEQELTSIVFRSSVAQTPTPFVIKNGTECLVHYNAKVTTVTGKKSAYVLAKLYYADADGTSNLTQIGVSATESETLTSTKALQESYIVVANEVSIPSGKRLVLKFFSVCSGTSVLYPEINVEYGDVHDHLSIPATGAVFGNFVPIAGGVTMTGSLVHADHEATGLVAQAVNHVYGTGTAPETAYPNGTIYSQYTP